MECGLQMQPDRYLAAWPALPLAKEHRRKKTESQQTQTTAAIPASISYTGPRRSSCSTGQGITGRWITQLQLLRYPSPVADEEKSNNKTANNMEKKESVFKSLAGSRPGCSAPSRMHLRAISLGTATKFHHTLLVSAMQIAALLQQNTYAHIWTLTTILGHQKEQHSHAKQWTTQPEKRGNRFMQVSGSMCLIISKWDARPQSWPSISFPGQTTLFSPTFAFTAVR